jgi:hypothetical protein
VSKPRSSDDLKGHNSGGATGDREGLLSLFGMYGQRSVGEAITIGFVSHIDHPAHDVDVPDGERRGHGDIHTHGWWTVGLHDQSGVAVHPPRAQRVDGSLEDVVAVLVNNFTSEG